MKKQEIALQSKKWIVDSFFDLLYNKPFYDISIAEIAENAELDRRTFYRHFRNKEDIISYYIQQTAKQYEEIIKDNTLLDYHSRAYTFFCICEQQKDILRLLYKQNLLYFLLRELDILFRKYQLKFAVPEELENENRLYILSYHTGGLWNLLITWVEENFNKTASQLSDIVHEICHEQADLL